MKSLGDVVSWVLAMILLFLALMLYRQSNLMALFALAGMVLVLPPTGRSLAKKTGFEGRFKQVSIGLALALLGGPIVASLVGGFTASGADKATTVEQAREAKSAHDRVAAAENRLAEEKAELAAYIDRIELEIDSIPDVKPSTYANGLVPINAGLAVIGAWAAIYEQGGRLGLDDETEKKRQRFRGLVAKKQAQMLPAMRDAYGPAMRQELWEADGSAKTFGPGFRTVEFVSAAFARNANIKKINDQMHDTLMMLRFTRAQYKWFNGASEYSYYTLIAPKDADVVRWNPSGSFQILD